MFKTSQKKKVALYTGLVVAAVMCAVDLNLLDGFGFQLAQIISSVSAVAFKVAAIFVKP